MKIESFEDIEAWQLARQLTRIIYALTMNPDFAKDFGLRNQIRDAAGSKMHNIAEGFDSESNKEFIRFFYAMPSAPAQKCKASCMLWPLIRIIYPRKNLRKLMLIQEEPEQR